MQQFLLPLAPAYVVFCFLSERNSPDGTEYENISTLYRCTQTQKIWKNGSFRIRENLQYKKAADLVLFSLFMRTNGKSTKSYAPSTGFSSTLLFVRTQYFWRTSIWKNINTISMYGEKIYQLYAAQRQLLRPLNNLEKQILQREPTL